MAVKSKLAYNSSFYEDQARGSSESAKAVIPLVNKLVQPSSVLDVGCGTGTWLAEWVSHGVADVIGLDGDYVDRSALQIEHARFIPTDLESGFSLGRKFDLVECLEVAEHLDEAFAEHFIKSLTSHADVVLFSAAVPGQGGTHHVNEQWPSYWIGKFQRVGFQPFDVIRPLIWTDRRVEVWYRQNILLFAKDRAFETPTPCIDFIHPELWAVKSNDATRPLAGLRRRSGLMRTKIRRAAHKAKRFMRSSP